MELPTTSLEEWRYSRIDGLDLDRFQPAGLRPTAAAAHPEVDALIAAVGATSAVVETRNGFVVGRSVSGQGIQVRDEADLSEAPAAVREPSDAFVVANRAYASDPLVISVGRGVAADPVILVHWVDADGVAVYPRTRIEAGEDSQLTVIEVVAGEGRALVAPLTELVVERAARVDYLHVQLLGEEAWQIGSQVSQVGADATLTSAAVSLGGHYARMRTDCALTGQGASSRLIALYFGAGGQMHDFRTVQDHRVPKTTSDLLYKGVVANTSRSVYTGLIRVEKGARGTNAFQTNRNLVLHEGAHADSVPNLEIEDNDVRCSHASAVGPVSEDERFYLESRGVPPEVTERLIALGFLGEVLERLPAPALGPLLANALATKLRTAEQLEQQR